MHAVLCNRMVLHLRSEAREKMGFTTQYDISTLDLGSGNRTLADAVNHREAITLRPMRPVY
jgi:hypothetical protein